MAMLYAIIAALVVSAASFVGLVFLFRDKQMHSRRIHMLLALAAGAMLGNAVLHLLPHAFSLEPVWHNPAPIVEVIYDHDHGVGVDSGDHDHDRVFDKEHAATPDAHSHGAHGDAGLYVALLLLGGMLAFYAFDLAIQRKSSDCKDSGGKLGGVASEGWLVLFGDGVENFLDGFVIGTSFLISIPAGIAATVTIFIHEIPIELGDYAVLRHAGFSRTRALLVNFASGLLSVVGVVIAMLLGSTISWFTFAATPIAAGAFLYIASSILIPKLRRECADGNGLIYFGMSLVGVASMVLVLFFE
ncbi:MAG: ZIP family metal transporter [Candidatus Obscuribacterales bacterium]|nr:ZIP family metal transporter [Candidatus Obscuribacterales bacterium]